jgi:peptidoglycan/LPS O-acetylase OafA/YrhL
MMKSMVGDRPQHGYCRSEIERPEVRKDVLVSVKVGNAKVAPLTSARFLAAIYVVMFHTAYNSGFQIPQWLKVFLSMGSYSVSFFFVLSGYILATVYLKGSGQIDLKSFWKARFGRVYPLFLLLLVLDIPYIALDRAARYG